MRVTPPTPAAAPQIQRYRSHQRPPTRSYRYPCKHPALPIETLQNTQAGEASEAIRARCTAAREIQFKRYHKHPANRCNSRMQPADIRKHCALSPQLSAQLQYAMQEFALSARAHDRILKVARTIADLAHSETIESPHLLEAIQYRSLDRPLF